MTATDPDAAFRPHDHRRCRADARAAVDAACAAHKLRLTPARACVLDALLESHRALTAYELLDRLRAAGLGSQPPVAYRALEFLLRHGFAHRIERLSAFVACRHAGDAHAAAFLVCRDCRSVAELPMPGPAAGVAAAAAVSDFVVERLTVEAEGVCARCATEAAA